MRDTQAALLWIVDILNKHKIPFQISGGFAAKLYGVKRNLADIDIDIPEDNFTDILEDVRKYIKYGPERFRDENWDLLLFTLEYENQEIDLAGALNAKIYNSQKRKWELYKTNFENSVIKMVYGVKIPVINLNDLIEYKSKLQREVDVQDVRQLLKISFKI